MPNKLATVSLDQSTWFDIHNALVAAQENSEHLLNAYINDNQDRTKITKCVERMYENEVSELRRLITLVEDNGGLPF